MPFVCQEGLGRRENKTDMYLDAHANPGLNSLAEAQGRPGAGEGGTGPWGPVRRRLQCGPRVRSLGRPAGQRNTSPGVSMATSQFHWNGKPRALEPGVALQLHVCTMPARGEEEEGVGNFYFIFP